MHWIRSLVVAIIVGCLILGISAKKENDSYKIEALPDSYADIGESPHWDVARQSLYYVDIIVGKILRYDYNANKVYRAQIVGETFASFIIPVDGTNDKFAVGCGRKVKIVTWDGVSKTAIVDRVLFEVETGEEFNENRFNDGKCDPNGRLFTGTFKYTGDVLAQRFGKLYKYDKGKVEVIKTDIGVSNGLEWNQDDKKMYYIDTEDYEVKEYNYDLVRGIPSNPKVVFDLHQPRAGIKLLPDGLTIDKMGNIYVATYNGHTLYKLDPKTGKVLLEIKFPVKRITSAAFGGPKLDILFVTTSAQFGETAPAGTTYKVTGLGVEGRQMRNLKP